MCDAVWGSHISMHLTDDFECNDIRVLISEYTVGITAPWWKNPVYDPAETNVKPSPYHFTVRFWTSPFLSSKSFKSMWTTLANNYDKYYKKR
jgi:hypothetical protein